MTDPRQGAPAAGTSVVSRLKRRPVLVTLVAVLLLSLATVGTIFGVTNPKSAPAFSRTPSLWAGSASVYPLPGTLTASPRTEISFRGVSAGDHGPIKVVGKKSGKHPGKIVPHRDGQGFSFVPRKNFRQGEEVRVRTDLSLRGARGGDYTFTVARGFHVPDPNPPDRQPKLGARLAPKFHDFVTRPGLHPPKVDVLNPAGPQTAEGHIFYTPKNRTTRADQEGPMIVNDQGKVVWFHPLKGKRAADFAVDHYRGEKVLIWWQGQIRHSFGKDRLVILDEHYKPVARVKSQGYADIDGHEVKLTPRGTALFFIKNPVMWDVPGDGKGKRPVMDDVIQEVDIATGRVLFEWHSLGHIDVQETYTLSDTYIDRPWDWLHANSIELDRNGDIIMSGRHTSAVYKIDRESGRIVWRLGGKRSDFEMGPGTTFSFQHDARIRPDGTITLFDNANGRPDPAGTDVSRGIALELDKEEMTASLVQEYEDPQGGMSTAESNMQTLPNGHVFIGWGNRPGYTEYTADGEVVYDAGLAEEMESYRSFRFTWHGHPTTDPAIALRKARGERTHVYVSWNGATEVATWQVVAGPSPERLHPVTVAPKRGFETRITVKTKADYVAVRARGETGEILATSPVKRVQASSGNPAPERR